jgi:hypothetical protein
MNITIEIVKALFEPVVHLYINYDNMCTTIFFRKHYGEYKSNEILFDDLLAKYLIETGYVTTIDKIVFNVYYPTSSKYSFKLSAKSLLQIL